MQASGAEVLSYHYSAWPMGYGPLEVQMTTKRTRRNHPWAKEDRSLRKSEAGCQDRGVMQRGAGGCLYFGVLLQSFLNIQLMLLWVWAPKIPVVLHGSGVCRDTLAFSIYPVISVLYTRLATVFDTSRITTSMTLVELYLRKTVILTVKKRSLKVRLRWAKGPRVQFHHGRY